jgi:hypothetical protein
MLVRPLAGTSLAVLPSKEVPQWPRPSPMLFKNLNLNCLC